MISEILDTVRVYSLKLFEPFAERLSKHVKIKEDLIQADIYMYPSTYISICLFVTMLITAGMIVLSIYLFLAGLHYIIPLLAISIPISFLLMLYYPKLQAKRVAREIETELPFFTVLSTFTGFIGKPILAPIGIGSSFERVRKGRVLKRFAKLSDKLYRSLFFDVNPLITLESYAKTSPSPQLSTYLENYVSISRIGGSLSDYLQRSMSEAIERLSSAWKKFVESSRIYADILLIFFILLPMSIYSMVMMGVSKETLLALSIYNYVVIPLLATFLIVILDMKMPRIPEEMGYYYRFLVIFMPYIFIIEILLSLGMKLHTSIAIATICSLIIPTIIYEKDRFIARKIEAKLEAILSDITELRRTGLPLDRAFQELRERRNYGKWMNKILERIAFNLRVVRNVREAIEISTSKVRSLLSRIMFWLLGDAIETGGGTEHSLSLLRDFASSYRKTTQDMASTMKTYYFIMYPCFIALIFISLQLIQYLLLPRVFMPIEPEIIESFKNLILSGLVVSSISAFLVCGKIASGTFYSGFKHVLIMMIACLIAFWQTGVL